MGGEICKKMEFIAPPTLPAHPLSLRHGREREAKSFDFLRKFDEAIALGPICPNLYFRTKLIFLHKTLKY